MYNHYLYFAYWVVNSLLFFLADFLIPDSGIRLGSWRFNSVESSLYAGFCLTFLIWVWWDFALGRKLNFENKIITFLFFTFANYSSIFAISQFNYFTGFEVTNYYWLFALAFAATIMQRFAWRIVVKNSSF